MISFYAEDIDFQLLQEEKICDWIKSVIELEDKSHESISFIFCSDEYLRQINLKYLEHDSLTDVISFPYSTEVVEGDIFISIERIQENSDLYEVSFEFELYRVMIHGILHLIGYGDKSIEEKARMTQREDHYLGMLTKWLTQLLHLYPEAG